jgi:chromosomal replication initiation ATPase DnaA
MSEAPRQLVLNLPVEPRHGPEDFLVSPSNEAAYATIERWPDWPDRIVPLIGPEGAGKTHLAAIWGERAHAWTISAFEVTLPRVPHLVSAGALVVEDWDRGELDEPALFHLINALRDRGGFAVLTARRPPDLWGLKTPDLISRLRLAPTVTLEAPDDALVRSVLVKLFVDRQLVIDTSVVELACRRMERSLAMAQRFVAELDREALSRGRRITSRMAADILAWLAPGEQTLQD